MQKIRIIRDFIRWIVCRYETPIYVIVSTFAIVIGTWKSVLVATLVCLFTNRIRATTNCYIDGQSFSTFLDIMAKWQESGNKEKNSARDKIQD